MSGPQPSKRLLQEIRHFASNAPSGMTAGPVGDDMSKWQALIQGPPDTPYDKGTFPLQIEFPAQYPFKPPVTQFLAKVYHPNVDDEGKICIGILKVDAWKPSTRILDVLKEIVLLLKHPNPDDPLNTAIAEQYRNNQAEFIKTAREWTSKHALPAGTTSLSAIKP